MGNGKWIVDVRGGVIGIYFAAEPLSGCSDRWPEPCLRIDGERVIDPERGEMVGWRMPENRIVTATRIAAALTHAGVEPQSEEPPRA